MSCQSRRNVTTTTPAVANAKAISAAPGTTSSAHGERTSPEAVMTARNARLTIVPRSTAHAISPTATSRSDNGVASIDSYVRSVFNFPNIRNVVSFIAPFMAAVASNAGAT